MCGRFAKAKSVEQTRERFGARRIADEAKEAAVGANVAPTEVVAVVWPDRAGGDRVVDAYGWGFKFPDKTYLNINAKIETARVRTWTSDLLSRRVIVPADWFDEWHWPEGKGSGKPKTRYSFFLPDRDELALAGLAHKTGKGDRDYRVVILTQPATERMAWCHERQPLVLPEDRWDDWLDPSLNTAAEALPMLAETDPPIVWEKSALR